MVTFDDFKKLDKLEQEIKDFLIERCNDVMNAQYYVKTGIDDSYKDQYLSEDFDWYEFTDSTIDVYFTEYRTFRCESNQYFYKLPLDIVFEPNFQEKIKLRLIEETEKERLQQLEYKKQHEADMKEPEEIKRREDIAKLHELIKKYPDEVNC